VRRRLRAWRQALRRLPSRAAAALARDRNYWLILAGCGLVVRGVYLMHEPSAYLVGGGILAGFGFWIPPPRARGAR
jgi:hypothetical protein